MKKTISSPATHTRRPNPFSTHSPVSAKRSRTTPDNPLETLRTIPVVTEPYPGNVTMNNTPVVRHYTPQPPLDRTSTVSQSLAGTQDRIPPRLQFIFSYEATHWIVRTLFPNHRIVTTEEKHTMVAIFMQFMKNNQFEPLFNSPGNTAGQLSAAQVRSLLFALCDQYPDERWFSIRYIQPDTDRAPFADPPPSARQQTAPGWRLGGAPGQEDKDLLESAQTTNILLDITARQLLNFPNPPRRDPSSAEPEFVNPQLSFIQTRIGTLPPDSFARRP